MAGEFGIVHAAHLVKGRGQKKKLTVAVKTLKCEAIIIIITIVSYV